MTHAMKRAVGDGASVNNGLITVYPGFSAPEGLFEGQHFGSVIFNHFQHPTTAARHAG